MSVLTGYCSIGKNYVITKRGRKDHSRDIPPPVFFKTLYKELAIDYPRFFKMDHLSKLAFLTAEFLFAAKEKTYKPEETALIFSNANASLDIDIRHNVSILDRQHYFPKPAVFVYTLPNIFLGELSIRHLFRGENTFFISKEFDIDFLTEYVSFLLTKTKHKACLLGRVDYLEGDFESCMCLVEKEGNPANALIFSKENIRRIYEGSTGEKSLVSSP